MPFEKYRWVSNRQEARRFPPPTPTFPSPLFPAKPFSIAGGEGVKMIRLTALCVAMSLSGCVEFGWMDPIGPFQLRTPPKAETEAEPVTEAPQAEEAEAEVPAAMEPPPPPAPAPSARETALRISGVEAEWDGAETTGGLWVALPYLPEYRRVYVTDPETGRAIVAKLFWRDPADGGENAVLSADAAAALGVKPGRKLPIEAAVIANE